MVSYSMSATNSRLGKGEEGRMVEVRGSIAYDESSCVLSELLLSSMLCSLSLMQFPTILTGKV